MAPSSGASNRGRGTVPPLSRAAIEDALRARGAQLGLPVHVTAITTSTMDEAMAAARAGAPSGSSFVTERQTQGRGRHGRPWHTEPGGGLAFSVLLRPDLTASEAPSLALVAGLAVRASIARSGVDALVKWPNDVLVGGRKIAGVLVESTLRGQRLYATVVGVGLNVSGELVPDLRDSATTLAALGLEISRVEMLVEILMELDSRLRRLPVAGLDAVLAELRAHDALAGKKVQVGHLRGVAVGLDPTGALLIEDPAGTLHPVHSGTVLLE